MEAIRQDLEARVYGSRFDYTQSLDDRQLVESFLMGNEIVFKELHKRYEKKIYRFIYKILDDPDDTEDVMQTTFLRAYKNIRKYNREYKFSTWLFKIAENLAKDKIRDNKKELLFLSYEQLQEYLPDENFDIFGICDQGNGDYTDLLNAVENAISNLGQRYKNIAFLRFIQNLKYKKIAEIEGIELSTLKARIHRARGQLKQKLQLNEAISNYL